MEKNVSLSWEAGEPSPNPFEALAGDNTEYVVHFSSSNAVKDDDVKLVLQECIDKAIDFFDENINQESEYFLIEWDPVYSMITLVVTNGEKTRDSRNVVKCQLEFIDAKMQNEGLPDFIWELRINHYSKKVKRWVKSYLQNRGAPKGCRLTPAFHSESRDLIEIL
jgi:hypothetical protein